MLNCCSKTAAIHSPTGALLLHLRRCKSLSSAMGVLKTFFFFLLEYGKKLLIHIETILLSVKQFLSYVIVKDQKHCQSGGEKKPKRKKKFSFRSTISPTFTSINSISMKWVLPLKSNFSLVRQCIDLDLDSLSAFLPKFFIFSKLTCYHSKWQQNHYLCENESPRCFRRGSCCCPPPPKRQILNDWLKRRAKPTTNAFLAGDIRTGSVFLKNGKQKSIG